MFSLNSLVYFYESKKDIEEMENVYEEVLIIYKTLAKTDLLNYNYMVASTLTSLAYIYLSKKDMHKSQKFFEEALVIEKSYANSKLERNSSVAKLLHNLTYVYKKTKQMKKAVKAYKESLILYKTLAKNNPKEYNILLANSLIMGVYTLNQPSKNIDDAEAILEEIRGSSRSKLLLKKIEKFRNR